MARSNLIHLIQIRKKNAPKLFFFMGKIKKKGRVNNGHN